MPGSRLRSGADITLDWPGGRLRLLAVHLKQGCRQERLSDSDAGVPARCCGRNWRRCRAGWRSAAPRGWPSRCSAISTAGWTAGDGFYAALQQDRPLLARATDGRSSPCWGGGGFVDHIIAGGAARGWMRAETLRVLVYRETGEEWRQLLSDHCPVSVRFALPD